MILWMIKLFGFVRQAIAGRRHPSQLAWAVAFGLLLGIVPHGNLLAVALLIVVLSLKLNHAMAMLTAVGATFLAVKLDPVSHNVGQYLYAQPKFTELATKAWALPLMPWTDLNNTVVLGSFTIGLLGILPIFLLTYPFFRLFAPKATAEAKKQEAPHATRTKRVDAKKKASSERVIYVDHGSSHVPAPHREAAPTAQPAAQSGGSRIDFIEVSPDVAKPSATKSDKNSAVAGGNPSSGSVETRIEVIRVKEPGNPIQSEQPATSSETTPSDTQHAAPNQPPQPMDEALNYLLRQLRDSQQRNAA